MTIYIAHLYYDLMNLYGEVGNIKVLEKTISDQGVKVVVDKITKGEKMDFNKYDLIYIGSGTEENQLTVLSDFIKYKNKIRGFIESNKFLIATGNSYELFGKSIYDGKKLHSGLNIFEFSSKYLKNRIVGDVIVKSKFIDKEIIGFQNRGSNIDYNENSNMFHLLNNEQEGYNHKNFYGTYLLGPILARNPELNEYLVKRLIIQRDLNFKFKKLNLDVDGKAYDEYMSKYHNI